MLLELFVSFGFSRFGFFRKHNISIGFWLLCGLSGGGFAFRSCVLLLEKIANLWLGWIVNERGGLGSSLGFSCFKSGMGNVDIGEGFLMLIDRDSQRCKTSIS